MTPPVDAATIRLMREASGLGMAQCRQAAQDAGKLSGDLVLALLAIEAHSFAVNISSSDPDVSNAQARRWWDLEHASSQRHTIADRSDAWRRLDAISPRRKKTVPTYGVKP